MRLHRKESAVCPIGPFCCEVPDSTGAMTRMCIIVASTSEGAYINFD